MWINLFPHGGALVETTPQAIAIPLQLPAEAAQVIAALLEDDDHAAAIAQVFLAGVRAGERSLATGRKVSTPPEQPQEGARP